MSAPEDPTRAAWAAVVEADHRLVESVSALTADELREGLTWCLGNLSSRATALRVLSFAHPTSTSRVLPALAPLLLVSHSLLEACRPLVLRLPPEERLDFLRGLTATVVDDPASQSTTTGQLWPRPRCRSHQSFCSSPSLRVYGPCSMNSSRSP